MLKQILLRAALALGAALALDDAPAARANWSAAHAGDLV
jgi:hypothetical protein